MRWGLIVSLLAGLFAGCGEDGPVEADDVAGDPSDVMPADVTSAPKDEGKTPDGYRPPPPPPCKEGASCDDGDECTKGTTCQGGKCIGGTEVTCEPPADACHTTHCDPALGCGSYVVVNGTPCEAPCFGAAACKGGVCVPEDDTAVVCQKPADPCVDSLGCDPTTGECTTAVLRAEGSPCDTDGDLCTLQSCDGTGLCATAGGVEDCAEQAASNPCSPWACEPAEGCVPGAVAEGEPCDDGDPCTEADVCSAAAGGCAGTPLEIDDGNQCTADTCSGGEVEHEPLSKTPCGGDPCQPGTCLDGECIPGTAPDGAGCGPGMVCAAGQCAVSPCPEDCPVCQLCDIGGEVCVPAQAGIPCGEAMICLAGQCKPAACAAPCGPCQVCNPVTQTCPPVEDGLACAGDGDPCTSDACKGGMCAHTALPDGTQCGGGKICVGGLCMAPSGCLAFGDGAPAPAAMIGSPVVVAMGSSVHVVGGNPGTQHLLYDAAAGTWGFGVKLPGLGIAEGVGGAIGGKVYAVHNAVDDKVRIYDPEAGTWKLGAERPAGGSGRFPAGGSDGKWLYALGGASANMKASAASHRYDPVTDSWAPVAQMKVARGQAASAVLSGTIIAAGGRDGSKFLSTVSALVTADGTWVDLPDLPAPRAGAAGAAANGFAYVVGGVNAAGPVDTVDVYDPDPGKWTTCNPLPSALSGHGAAGHASQVLVFGGGTSPKALLVGTPL